MKEAVDDDVEEAVGDDDTEKRNDRECCCCLFVRSTEFRGSTMERAKALAKESPGGDATVEDDDEESDTIVTIARSTIIVVIRMLSILLLLLMAVFDPMLVLLVFKGSSFSHGVKLVDGFCHLLGTGKTMTDFVSLFVLLVLELLVCCVLVFRKSSFSKMGRLFRIKDVKRTKEVTANQKHLFDERGDGNLKKDFKKKRS